MVNIVFCLSEGRIAGIENLFDFQSATHIIKYPETVLLLENFLTNLLLHTKSPITVKLLLSYKGELNLIDIRRISYIEISKRVVGVHVAENPKEVYRAYAPIADVEKVLMRLGFMRVSRFYVVSINHIRKVGKTLLQMSAGEEIPIGRPYREQVLARLVSPPNIVVS